MKPINLKASRIFEKLIILAEANNGHIKIDNASGVYMPLSVEKIAPNTYAFAHYYEQNSDMMRDPEILLWRSSLNQRLYPIRYRQDPYLDQELVRFGADERPERYSPKAQKDAAVFCGTWAENLREQQNL